MYCTRCGGMVQEGAAFCSNCGQPQISFAPGASGVPQQTAPEAAGAPGAPSASPTPQVWNAAMSDQAVAGVNAMERQVYAGFWLRFVAWIIDRLVLQVVGMVILVPFWIALGLRFAAHPPENPTPEEAMQFVVSMFSTLLPIIFIAIAINWLYYALMESSSWQATLGKKALGLYVTDLEGRRVSFGRASGRYFARIVSSMTILIGYIMAGFTAKKQALHDMIASCLVMRKS